MLNYCTKFRAAAVCALLCGLGARADGPAVSNELRFTSIDLVDGALNITVDGLGSAASNGCNYVSLGFIDMLGSDNTLWPKRAGLWLFDYEPIARHFFNDAKNYQVFSGAHTYRVRATADPVAVSGTAGLPDFEVGDGQGFELVERLPHEQICHVYGGAVRDGVFLYRDMFTPHWMVWSTNGTRWQSGWPWVNVPITTNSTTHVFERVPVEWEIATQARAVSGADGFCLIPGRIGEIEDFYLAHTETTEGSASTLVAWGAERGLCASGCWPSLPGRGTNYPVTGWPLDAALALCNLATVCHNECTGEDLETVYSTNGAAFFSPGVDVRSVVRDERARGYRLPVSAEYRHAAGGDARTRYPWGDNDHRQWRYATNGLPVTEFTLDMGTRDLDEFDKKYHLFSTNSVGNYVSRNGGVYVSPARVRPVRDGYREWSIPAINTNGQPVMVIEPLASRPFFFGDKLSDAAWGTGGNRCYDLSGNVGEMVWPPIVRQWGDVRVEVRGGNPMADSSACSAAAGGFTVRAAAVGSTVGFRFARNKRLVDAGGGGAKSMAASFDGGKNGLATREDPGGETRGVMFLASASAPAPVEPVFPKGWSNEVELVKASIKKVYSVTNFYGAWGDDAARSAARAARDEMVRYWVEVFRTNGIPEEFMERRRGVRPAVKDPDVIEVKENITPALKAR